MTRAKIKSFPVHTAAAANDTKKIKTLLANVESRKNMLVMNEKGQTPLHVAIENHHYNASVMLIQEGSSAALLQDNKGNTPLHLAEHQQFLPILGYIFNLTYTKKLMTVQNKDGDTPFHIAVALRTMERRDVMAYMKYNSKAIFNLEGYTPFHLAIKLDKWNVVETMLKQQPHLAKQLSLNGEPPLWVALNHGQIDMMWKLLKNNGCDVNQINTKVGAPTIWLAIYRQDTRAIQLLLVFGEGFDKATLLLPSADGISPLLLAMIREHKRLVNHLFSVSTGMDDWDTLALKVKYGLASRADIDKIDNPKSGNGNVTDNTCILHQTDDHGYSLLHYAVLSDSLEMVQIIVTAGGGGGGGSWNIESVIHLACERQCMDVVGYLRRMFRTSNCTRRMTSSKTFSVTKDFPRFSDKYENISDQLKLTNKRWPMIEHIAMAMDQTYEDMKKYIIKKVTINWTKTSNIQKDENGLPVSLPPLSHMKLHLKKANDDFNTAMIKDFISILVHVEVYLREKDELFKHLGVVLFPVGSIVEGTKVFKLNELDVMLFCMELHGFLSVIDERTICLSEDKYNNLPMIIKDLFDNKTRELDIANFFYLLMQSIKKAIHGLVTEGKVPEKVKLFLDGTKCTRSDCKENNKDKECWRQCCHKEPPCVCYTSVGAGLNFVWCGENDPNMVFTIDIVPNFYVDLNGHSSFSLRQKLIQYLTEQNPVGWVGFLKKYIQHDRIYLGQYDLEEKNVTCICFKMVNSKGDFVIKPGLNMGIQELLEDEVIHEAYCFLKVLKGMTASEVKSFDLKKALSVQRGFHSQFRRPLTAFDLMAKVLNNPDLIGKFNGLCQPLAEKNCHGVFLQDQRNSRLLKLGGVSKDIAMLIKIIQTGTLESLQKLLGKLESAASNVILPNEKSLLHVAAEEMKVEMVSELLLTANYDINFRDFDGNTVLHCVLLTNVHFIALSSIAKTYEQLNASILDDTSNSNDGDSTYPVNLWAIFAEMVKLLCEQPEIQLELQNKKKETVFHLMSQAYLGPVVADMLLSKATDNMLTLKDQTGQTALHIACLCNAENNIINGLLAKGAAVNALSTDGLTPLHLVCRGTNDYERANLLLTQGAKINATDNFGYTPLMYACLSGNPDVVWLLLDRGAKINMVNKEGKTALHIAATEGHYDIVDQLVQTSRVNINVCSVFGTPLIYALSFRHVKVAKLLLQKGADVNRFHEDSMTPLSVASRDGMLEMVRLLLDYGALIDLTSGCMGTTPLYIAATNGHLQVVKYLINRGANVNMASRHLSITPLCMASQEGSLSVVKLLIKNNADVNFVLKENGQTPLYMASRNGHLEVVKNLLKNGAKMNVPVGDKGCTPLLIAIQYGHVQVVELLLKYSALMDKAIKTNALTPLLVASKNDHLEMVKVLLKNGAAVDQAMKSSGLTPLFIASRNGHVEVVELLLKHGATVDRALRNNGFTPLLRASSKGHLKVVKLFLKGGASVDLAINVKGLTPLFLASRNGHLKVVELLLKYNATVDLATKTNGLTSLFVASRNGHLEVVKLLLKNGAAVDLTMNTNGLTPLFMASKHGRLEVVRCLLGSGANANLTVNCKGATRTLGHDLDKKPLIGISPLAAAAMYGHADIVHLLMSNKAYTLL